MGEVAAEQDAAVAAARLVHAVAVVGVGVRPQQVEEEVVLERARRLHWRRVELELLHRRRGGATAAVDDEDLRATVNARKELEEFGEELKHRRRTCRAPPRRSYRRACATAH